MSHTPTFVIFDAAEAKLVAACYKFRFTHLSGEK